MAIVIGAKTASAEVPGFGPFPVRNFQPFQLLILGMFGDRAETLKKGVLNVRAEFANTSSIFDEQTNPPQFALVRATVKFETLRSGLFFRYGLTDKLEIGMEIPALYRYSGVMEGLITGTERALAQMTSTREALKQTDFAFNVSRNGTTLFSGGNNQLGLGDITLIGKYQAFRQTAVLPAVAVRFAVKAPTGDSARFFGSGHPDVGIGLALEKAVASRLILYGNVNGVFPTGTISGLKLHPVVSGIAAAELLVTSTFSIVAQFDYYSSAFDNTAIKLLDRGVTEVVAGVNYRLRSNLLWQIYGVENVDFITGAAADFTLSTVLTYRFPY
jgi:hypothetical protein